MLQGMKLVGDINTQMQPGLMNQNRKQTDGDVALCAESFVCGPYQGAHAESNSEAWRMSENILYAG